MQEIAPNLFIEQHSLGMVTGIIRLAKSTTLVDYPFRQDEVKSWRAATSRMVSGDARYLIMLDTHYDRLLSAKASNCTMIAHANTVLPARLKIINVKGQDEALVQTESFDPTGNVARLLPPEITFEDSFTMHLDEFDIKMKYRPGANYAAIWVELEAQKIIFVGDSVMVDQPPFLGFANPDIWVDEMELLAGKDYRGYQIVSTREGIVNQDQVKKWGEVIHFIRDKFASWTKQDLPLEEWFAHIPDIMMHFNPLMRADERYYNRLRWGIRTWYDNMMSSKSEVTND